MPENLLWSLIPSELKLPNLAYHYFAKAPGHPFRSKTSALSLENAAWLTDLAFLAYADEQHITARIHAVGLTGTPCFIGFDQKDSPTQCVIAHNNDIIIVIFRGTEFSPKRILDCVLDASVDLQAALVKMQMLGGYVHQGFFKEAENIYPILSKKLNTIRTTQTLWFAGHSMGGALAMLTAKLYTVRTHQSVNGVYTMGCPRVGDEAFAANYQLPLFSLINNQDPITRIPTGGKLSQLPSNFSRYAPAGNIIFFNQVGDIAYTDNRPPIASDFLQIGSTPGLSLVMAMLDHAPYRYSRKIWQQLR